MQQKVKEKDFPTTYGIQTVMSLNPSLMESENSNGYLLKTMYMTHNTVLNKDLKPFEILGITDRDNRWDLKTKEYTISDTPNFTDLNRRGAVWSNGSLVSTYARLLIRKL